MGIVTLESQDGCRYHVRMKVLAVWMSLSVGLLFVFSGTVLLYAPSALDGLSIVEIAYADACHDGCSDGGQDPGCGCDSNNDCGCENNGMSCNGGGSGGGSGK